MKKIIQLLTVTLISIILIGTLTAAKADETLTVGVQTEKRNHNSSAFDRKLAKQIGKKLNRIVKIKTYSSHQALEQAVDNHRIDLAMGMSTTKHNLVKTTPYLYLKNELISLYSTSLFKLKNQSVGILDESGQKSQLQNLELHINSYHSLNELVAALDNKKVKAIVINQYQINHYLNNHPDRENAANIDKNAKPFHKINDPQILSQQLFAITSNKHLAHQVSDVIEKLRLNGTLTKLSAKYYHYNFAFK